MASPSGVKFIILRWARLLFSEPVAESNRIHVGVALAGVVAAERLAAHGAAESAERLHSLQLDVARLHDPGPQGVFAPNKSVQLLGRTADRDRALIEQALLHLRR